MHRRLLPFVAVLLAVATSSGCSSSASGCANPIREQVDPNSAIHLIDPSQGRYLTDPPTSGAHLFKPPPLGKLSRQLSPAEQVTILELGVVLVQYRDASAAAALEPLANDLVTVAPNTTLPAPVMATAWTYKLSCQAVDLAKINAFVAAHKGKPISPS